MERFVSLTFVQRLVLTIAGHGLGRSLAAPAVAPTLAVEQQAVTPRRNVAIFKELEDQPVGPEHDGTRHRTTLGAGISFMGGG